MNTSKQITPTSRALSDSERMDFLEANILSGPTPPRFPILSRDCFAVWDAELTLREAIDVAVSRLTPSVSPTVNALDVGRVS